MSYEKIGCKITKNYRHNHLRRVKNQKFFTFHYSLFTFLLYLCTRISENPEHPTVVTPSVIRQEPRQKDVFANNN